MQQNKRGLHSIAKSNTSRGFTLIELLVVIAIIGLLSTLAVIALNNARQKSRDAKRVSDIKQLQSALELYYNDANGYPPEAANGEIEGDCLSYDVDAGGGFETTCQDNGNTFMNIVPTNTGPGGMVYIYEVEDAAGVVNRSYSLTYELESGAGGLGAGMHTASEKGITLNSAGVSP